MLNEWEVEFTLAAKGKTSFFCDTKEEAEEMAHNYFSYLLYPDCRPSYEIKGIKNVSPPRRDL